MNNSRQDSRRPAEHTAATRPERVTDSIVELQQQLQSLSGIAAQHIDCSPENLEQGLARLVLGLVELLRKLLERQAIRRMEGDTLSPQQVEDVGLALMKLEQKIAELAAHFGLRPEDLNLELGPLGSLWHQ